jgi:hypothetical protein
LFIDAIKYHENHVIQLFISPTDDVLHYLQVSFADRGMNIVPRASPITTPPVVDSPVLFPNALSAGAPDDAPPRASASVGSAASSMGSASHQELMDAVDDANAQLLRANTELRATRDRLAAAEGCSSTAAAIGPSSSPSAIRLSFAAVTGLSSSLDPVRRPSALSFGSSLKSSARRLKSSFQSPAPTRGFHRGGGGISLLRRPTHQVTNTHATVTAPLMSGSQQETNNRASVSAPLVPGSYPGPSPGANPVTPLTGGGSPHTSPIPPGLDPSFTPDARAPSFVPGMASPPPVHASSDDDHLHAIRLAEQHRLASLRRDAAVYADCLLVAPPTGAASSPVPPVVTTIGPSSSSNSSAATAPLIDPVVKDFPEDPPLTSSFSAPATTLGTTVRDITSLLT